MRSQLQSIRMCTCSHESNLIASASGSDFEQDILEIVCARVGASLPCGGTCAVRAGLDSGRAVGGGTATRGAAIDSIGRGVVTSVTKRVQSVAGETVHSSQVDLHIPVWSK